MTQSGSSRSLPLTINPTCPGRFVLRLIIRARVCLFALLFIPTLSVPLRAQEDRLPDLQEVHALLSAGEDEHARRRIVVLLTPEFAAAHPAEAAVLSRQLSDIGARTGDWSGIYEQLEPIAEPLIAVLQGDALDNVLADVALAAGMAKKVEAQDRWSARAVSIAIKQAGEHSERALGARANAAYSLLNANRDAEALRRILQTLDTMEACGAADMFFKTASQAGDAFYRLAGQEAGGTVFQRAIESPLIQTDQGPGKGFFWFNAGVFLRDIGDYQGAIRLQRDAMTYLFRSFGEDSQEGLTAYDGLAQTLHAAGKLSEAEAAYRYVFDASRKALGENHPNVWQVANNLAAVLRSLKLPIDALALDRFAYNKRLHALGAGATNTLISHYNIAQDLIDAGRLDEAGETLAALARITEDPGYNARFREMIVRWQDYVAYRGRKTVLSRAEIERRYYLDLNLGIEQRLAFFDLYADRAEDLGWTERALALRTEALDIAHNRFGNRHPFSFDAALDRARLLEKVDPQEAVTAYQDLNRVMFDWTRTNVRSSGSLASGFAAKVLSSDLRRAFAGFATRNAEAAEAYAASLDQWKTLTSHTERALRRDAETTEDPNYRRLIEAYLNATGHLREIVTVSLFTPDLIPLDQEMRQIRTALNVLRDARGLPGVGLWIDSDPGEFQPVSRPAAGDVIVELSVTYTWLDNDKRKPTGFVTHALISRHDRPPEVVEVNRFTFKAAVDAPARPFRAVIARHLADWSRGAKTLTIVPDAFLFQVPFAELRVDDGKRLGEIVNLRMATSRQAYDFRDTHAHFRKGRAALLVGGLVAAEGDPMPELPASVEEVEAIASIARAHGREAHVLRGMEGTEVRVRAASDGPSVLHFATHGFYRAGGGEKNQLYNSGFTLAAARPTGQENRSDNVVYARELLGWDLRGVDLVTIAACDTALGDLGLTSTLRGLPLALSVAGARRTLLTIDEVPDTETARFMARFYEHLITEDMSYVDAFIATKRDAWANRIDGVAPETARAFILFEN